MKIHQIVKRDDKKVLITFENQQEILLNKDIVYQYGLRKFDDLSDEQIEQLLKEEKKYNIKLKALSLLKRRTHSHKELLIKLKRHFSEVELIEECLSDLEQKKIIDDRNFTELFIQEKIRFKKWSKSKLKSELYQRGIKKEIIEDCLSNLFDSNLEKQKAIELANKKLKQIQSKTTDKKAIYAKLMMFLQSKGYDYELISEILNHLLKTEE
ncbi:MAG: recombination regulator RecX [Ignavibacterium sp.]|nr:recombination regulator RecX [Ignavibacterium sp.]